MGHRSVIKNNKNILKYTCLEDDIKLHFYDSDEFNRNIQQIHIKYAMACC